MFDIILIFFLANGLFRLEEWVLLKPLCAFWDFHFFCDFLLFVFARIRMAYKNTFSG